MVFFNITSQGFRLTHTIPDDKDLTWWRDNVGVPPPPFAPLSAAPPLLPGRPGSFLYLHSDGGRGSDGGSLTALSSMRAFARQGIVAHKIEASGSTLLWGQALGGADGRYAFRMGVALPVVLVERVFIYSRSDGSSPSQVTGPMGPGWQSRPRWGAIAIVAAVLGVLAAVLLQGAWSASCTLRRAKSRRKGQCPHCVYELNGLMDSTCQCPECGGKLLP